MLTPAISDSSTSVPEVISENAFSTQVTVPPFLYSLPFAEAITAGLTLFLVITTGPCPGPGEVLPNAGDAAAAARPAVLVTTKSRRGKRLGLLGAPNGRGFGRGRGF